VAAEFAASPWLDGRFRVRLGAGSLRKDHRRRLSWQRGRDGSKRSFLRSEAPQGPRPGLGEGPVKWYTPVVHNGFPRSPKVLYLLGFLHRADRWKRVPFSPPLQCSPLYQIVRIDRKTTLRVTKIVAASSETPASHLEFDSSAQGQINGCRLYCTRSVALLCPQTAIYRE